MAKALWATILVTTLAALFPSILGFQHGGAIAKISYCAGLRSFCPQKLRRQTGAGAGAGEPAARLRGARGLAATVTPGSDIDTITKKIEQTIAKSITDSPGLQLGDLVEELRYAASALHSTLMLEKINV